MSKFNRDPFSRLYAPPDREGDAAAIEKFLQNGGKVVRLKDSREADEILKRRKRRQIVADRRQEQENPRGVIGGIPLKSDLEVLQAEDEE
jgi:hypothetical protein